MKIPNWHKKFWKEVSHEKPDMMVFWWGWCRACECAYLECPKCNNNSCNGGHGTIRKDGIIEEACDVCWLASQYESLAHLLGEYPESPEEIDYYNNRILARLGVSLDGEITDKRG